MIRVIIIIICVLTFCSCNESSENQLLRTSISGDTTLILTKLDGQRNIWGINLKILGDFKDTIILSYTNGDNVSYKHAMIGEIDTLYHTDWYNDSCLIRFENVNEAIQDLQVEYEFLDL